VFHEGTLNGLSDRQLLQRFVEGRDEAAFELLVARHGPMVLNVCSQLLHDPHDVDDAFQAVFLVLIRKASTVRVENSLGPWLYTVANRVAARARANRRRTAAREVSAAAERAESPPENSVDRLEAAVVIQEELGHLPARLRAPLVLCYLQGMTHELAAGELGCPVGTVRSRLSRARAQLLRRITRRGLTLSAAALVAALESNARAVAIPPNVRITLIKLAAQWVPETAATVGGLGASASVAALLEGVLNVMRIKKLAVMATGLVAMGTLGFVIADRAAAVGGSPLQESAPSSTDPVIRQVGPDGRPVGALLAKPRPETVTKTYYVGDLVEAPQLPGAISTIPVSGGPAAGVRPMVNVQPVMDLIASTVAPGTWNVDDGRGPVIVSRTNSMVPFYLSISLIVRCPEEVHDQVANLLRLLRVLIHARDNRAVQEKTADHREAFQLKSSPAPPRGNLELPVPKARAANAVPPASRPRVQELLEELQKEIAKFPSTVDTRFAPDQSTVDTRFAPRQ
jgi:RNA polymerase sigma factor (sigma-70 family)